MAGLEREISKIYCKRLQFLLVKLNKLRVC